MSCDRPAIRCALFVGRLMAVLLALVLAKPSAVAAPQATKPGATKTLGIGFGLSRETGDLPLTMKGENDFVDTMARGGRQ